MIDFLKAQTLLSLEIMLPILVAVLIISLFIRGYRSKRKWSSYRKPYNE